MDGEPIIQTPRLSLRRWHPSDEAEIALIDRDPEVTRYLNPPVTPAARFSEKCMEHWELAQRPELGWRLARDSWGRGLATEAAVAVRKDAFERLGLDELISIIHPDNAASRRVATKIGMRIEGAVHHSGLDRDVDVWQLSAPAAV